MQYAHYELKKSGNDALDSLIAKTYGLQNSGSTFVLHGNLNDIYDDLLGIQELARHFNVSDAFEAEAERIANAMYKSLESYREAIVSRFFRKFNFCHLVSSSQPAILSDPASSAML